MKKEFTARVFDFGKDYPEVCEWWRARGWPCIPKSSLSDMGIVVEENGIKHCVAWLFRGHTNFGWLEWLVANPSAPILSRKDSISFLIDRTAHLAKGFGIEVIHTSLANDNLIDLFQKSGFQVTDSNMTNLMMRI